MAIDNRSGLVQLANHTAIAPDEGVDKDSAAATTDIQDALMTWMVPGSHMSKLTLMLSS